MSYKLLQKYCMLSDENIGIKQVRGKSRFSGLCKSLCVISVSN